MCPGCSVSQSAHAGDTRIEVRPCICSTNRNLLLCFSWLVMRNANLHHRNDVFDGILAVFLQPFIDDSH